MIFWDSSAIVPLIVAEDSTDTLLEILERDREMLVWWGSPTECTSAISRRERQGDLIPEDASRCLARLRELSGAWNEVNPTEVVRITALRILRTHPLPAADALQLAAAVAVADRDPGSLKFLTLDKQLEIAAGKEGFEIVAV